MSKDNLFTKKLKKQIIYINDLIESYFNKFGIYVATVKKTGLSRNKRVFLITAVIFILSLSYFLIPTLYDKNIIRDEIKNQILKKYNIDIEFDENIKYGLLPKPHFVSKNSFIVKEKNNIANIGNLKIFISLDKFFSFNKIEIRDLIFQNTDFNFYKGDINFFNDLLKTEPNANKIVIKKSNVFFKDENDEVLFLNKIYNSKYYYDSNNLENILSAKIEIFKIPFKLTVKNDKFNKQFYTKLNSKLIRLNLENYINYESDDADGILDIIFVNKNTSIDYLIKKNSLNFSSLDKKNPFKGNIDFKPFYFYANFNYTGLSTKNLFKENSILLDLVKSEMLNNINLNIDIDFNVADITNIDELNDLSFKLNIEQGNISPSDSSIMWKDDLKITLVESLFINDEKSVNLVGKILVDIADVDDFYKSFQIKKDLRKKIKQFQIDFNYNFNTKQISFDNVKIDNNSNESLETFINNFNSREKRIFNKITFKNFVNDFFKAYAG